jgi:hypothetical protein
MTFKQELQNIPALQGCVTVICAMTLCDYLSAWSVARRDGGQLISRPSKARMLGPALYSIKLGMLLLDKAAGGRELDQGPQISRRSTNRRADAVRGRSARHHGTDNRPSKGSIRPPLKCLQTRRGPSGPTYSHLLQNNLSITIHSALRFTTGCRRRCFIPGAATSASGLRGPISSGRHRIDHVG